MANKLYEESTIQALADAIRSKSGKTDKMTVSDMATETENLFDAKRFIEGTATDLKIPENVTKIKDYSFYNCTNLALTSLPEGITSIGIHAFYNCTNLALTSLPEGLTSISDNTFYNCSNLALTSLPEGITSIGQNSFANCTGFITLTFKGTPTSIHLNAFSGYTNLTTINVPWSEGAVANAPWGATKATINYDYVEESEEETES